MEKQRVLHTCLCMCARAYVRACVWVGDRNRRRVHEGARTCSLAYPACNAYAPYCHSSPLWLHQIFRNYLINGTIFEKKVLSIKLCFYFLYNFFLDTSHSKKNLERYCQKCEKHIHAKYPLFLSDFNETWIFSTGFRKSLKHLI